MSTRYAGWSFPAILEIFIFPRFHFEHSIKMITFFFICFNSSMCLQTSPNNFLVFFLCVFKHHQTLWWILVFHNFLKKKTFTISHSKPSDHLQSWGIQKLHGALRMNPTNWIFHGMFFALMLHCSLLRDRGFGLWVKRGPLNTEPNRKFGALGLHPQCHKNNGKLFVFVFFLGGGGRGRGRFFLDDVEKFAWVVDTVI